MHTPGVVVGVSTVDIHGIHEADGAGLGKDSEAGVVDGELVVASENVWVAEDYEMVGHDQADDE